MNCPLCKSFSIDCFKTIQEKYYGKREYLKCSDCHLIFLSRRCHLGKEEEKARYDLHENSPDDVDYVKFLKRLANPLSVKLSKGQCGLDYGCGPGPTLSEILKEQGLNVSNYDPLYFPNSQLLNQRYDFVTATEVVEHFRNPREEFQRLKSFLKANKSYLGLMTKMWTPQTDFDNWHYRREPSHICFYKKETFQFISNWMGWSVEFPVEDVVIYSNASAA